jgi:hypothetical protein
MKFFNRKTLKKVATAPITAPMELIEKGKDKAMNAILIAVIRHALTTIGGGTMIASDSEIQAFIGAVVTAAGIAWSVYDKIKNRKKQ